MKGLKKQRRIQVILIAMVFLAAATALIGTALRDGISFFRSPSEVAAEPPMTDEVFRLGGLVEVGSIEALEGVRFRFAITDGGATVPVRYEGNNPRPDLFEEGQGTIATGRLVDGVFVATEILAKHDETYMPKEVIDALKEQGVYQNPDG
ncbi:MAG: cytochrome c maturation protein CcmE [Pseudomonadota bacterium]